MDTPPIPGCVWATDALLVRVKRSTKPALSQTLLQELFAADVACSVNLLSKQEFRDAGADALFNPLADAVGKPSARQRAQPPRVVMTYQFWAADGLPTARQVRQALESIEDAQTYGLRLLINGVSDPARAVIVAGCWLAHQGHEGEAARLGWLARAHAVQGGGKPPAWLTEEARAFVADWPTGSEGQPPFADMDWSDRDEVFPFATVDHWLGTLPTVRVYTARGSVRPVDVPVIDGCRVSNGADIDLDLDELRRGVWIGERTLRLPNGWQVVFVPS